MLSFFHPCEGIGSGKVGYPFLFLSRAVGFRITIVVNISMGPTFTGPVSGLVLTAGPADGFMILSIACMYSTNLIVSVVTFSL